MKLSLRKRRIQAALILNVFIFTKQMQIGEEIFTECDGNHLGPSQTKGTEEQSASLDQAPTLLDEEGLSYMEDQGKDTDPSSPDYKSRVLRSNKISKNQNPCHPKISNRIFFGETLIQSSFYQRQRSAQKSNLNAHIQPSNPIKSIDRKAKGQKASALENFKNANSVFKTERKAQESSKNQQFNSSEEVAVLRIPLNTQNILTLTLIVVLTVIGTFYLWVLMTQKRCNCRLCRKEFIVLDSIGEGGFGAVFLVQKPISQKVSQKQVSNESKQKNKQSRKRRQDSRTSDELNKTRSKRYNEEGKKYILKKLEMKDLTDLERVQQEAKQLRRMNHRNIVSYEDEFMHINDGTMGSYYIYIIIMEYCQGGDLTDKIREHHSLMTEKWGQDLATPERVDSFNVSMPENKVMKYFIEICEAVRYIHARDIIHRDIKSPNIFITEDDSAKLGDFGLCVQGKSIKTKAKYSTVGTENYFSPEMIKGQLFQKGKTSDMWALGLVLLEMMTGCPVWDTGFDFGVKAIEHPHFIGDYLNDTVPQKYDPKLKSILKKLLLVDPHHRATIEEVMRKKFIRQWQHKLRVEYSNQAGYDDCSFEKEDTGESSNFQTSRKRKASDLTEQLGSGSQDKEENKKKGSSIFKYITAFTKRGRNKKNK